MHELKKTDIFVYRVICVSSNEVHAKKSYKTLHIY